MVEIKTRTGFVASFPTGTQFEIKGNDHLNLGYHVDWVIVYDSSDTRVGAVPEPSVESVKILA